MVFLIAIFSALVLLSWGVGIIFHYTVVPVVYCLIGCSLIILSYPLLVLYFCIICDRTDTNVNISDNSLNFALANVSNVSVSNKQPKMVDEPTEPKVVEEVVTTEVVEAVEVDPLSNKPLGPSKTVLKKSKTVSELKIDGKDVKTETVSTEDINQTDKPLDKLLMQTVLDNIEPQIEEKKSSDLNQVRSSGGGKLMMEPLLSEEKFVTRFLQNNVDKALAENRSDSEMKDIDRVNNDGIKTELSSEKSVNFVKKIESNISTEIDTDKLMGEELTEVDLKKENEIEDEVTEAVEEESTEITDKQTVSQQNLTVNEENSKELTVDNESTLDEVETKEILESNMNIHKKMS